MLNCFFHFVSFILLLMFSSHYFIFFFFFFNDTATTEIYTFPYTTLFRSCGTCAANPCITNPKRIILTIPPVFIACDRSEEHTSELQSHVNLVCRLLLEKKKKKQEAQINDQKKNKIVQIPK